MHFFCLRLEVRGYTMCNKVGTENIVPRYRTITELAKESGIPAWVIRRMIKDGESFYSCLKRMS